MTTTANPFLSEGSPYPLLTAWYYGRLEKQWQLERFILREAGPTQHPEVVGHQAAAKLAVLLSLEYERLEHDINQKVRKHFIVDSTGDPLIRFYDALQDDDIPSYRQILQDVSGTRTMAEDEQVYRELLQRVTKEGETI